MQLCMDPWHYAKFQKKKLMTQSQENLRTDGRTDGTRTDRPYFIGPFWSRLGIQQTLIGLIDQIRKQKFVGKNISSQLQPLNFERVFDF